MRKVINSIGSAAEKIGNAFDQNTTSKEEVLDIIKDVEKVAIEAETQIILEEARGNFLQRTWRPFMMLVFSYVIVHTILIAPILEFLWGIPRPDMPLDKVWDILQISISGYVIGRTGEKVLPKMTDVADKVLTSRRERKEAKRDERKN